MTNDSAVNCEMKTACADPPAASGVGGKYRRLVDFDTQAWNALIRMKIEMEDRQNRIRVSISDVVNTILKAPASTGQDSLIAGSIKAELLKLWSASTEKLSEYQRGFEAGLMYALQRAR